MKSRSILKRRRRRMIKKDFELQLTSMMDMLIILLVFLLKSYSASAVNIATSAKVKLPISTVEELPVDSVSLIVEPTQILLDNEKVIEFKQPSTYAIEPHLLQDSGRKILPLYDALIKAKEKAELVMSKAVWKDGQGKTTQPKFQGTLLIHADQAMRYEFLRKVMYTAGAAQFKIFKLVTVRKDAS